MSLSLIISNVSAVTWRYKCSGRDTVTIPQLPLKVFGGAVEVYEGVFQVIDRYYLCPGRPHNTAQNMNKIAAVPLSIQQ